MAQPRPPVRILASLRARLLLLIAVAILPVLGVKLYNAELQRRNAVELALQDALQVTRLVAANQSEFIDYTRQLLFTLSQLTIIREGNLGPCNTLLNEIVQQFPLYTNIYTVDADGELVCSGVPREPGALNVSENRWFDIVRESTGFVLGNYAIGQFTGLGTVPAIVPLRDAGGNFTGAVIAGISLLWMNDFLENTSIPQESILAVLDKEGTVLAVYPPEAFREAIGQDASENPIFLKMQEVRDGTSRFQVGNGVGVLMGITETGDESSGIYIVLLQAEANTLAAVNEFQNQVLFLLLATSAVVLILTAIGSQRLLMQPIQGLIDATAQLGQGDLGARADARRGISELDALAASFNTMAAQLEQRERQLAATNAGLEHEIEERRQAEEELKKFAAQLESSNQELEQFAYVASHDLQEPLRVVAGYLQLLERRYKGRLDTDADEFIAFAVDAAKRMQNLINDLLAYSRIGRKIRPFEATDTERVVNEARRNLTMLVEESDATITVEPLPTVMADPAQLVLVFQNLIANGIKFRGEAPPEITIGARECPDVWEFFVRDNGIGIDPQYNERIFLIFQRLHTRDEYPGTGIGLAICQKIIEYHGGKIWVASEVEKGTTFHFTLPKQEEDEVQ